MKRGEWYVATGDACDELDGMPDRSVQCCVTSPPYFGLRRYTDDEHEIGQEETAKEYVASLVDVFERVRRVLRQDGTLWLVLGDCYAGAPAGNARPDHSGLLLHGTRGGQKWTNGARTNPKRRFDEKPKDLVGIPWRVAFGLREAGWWLRADLIWAKPNPLPDPVADRPTRAHEYVFLLSKSRRYYYDADAIAEPATGRGKYTSSATGRGKYTSSEDEHMRTKRGLSKIRARSRKNRRSVWEVPTVPFHGAHTAVMPPMLALLCILAGSRKGDCVLDPFCGSGTVGMVAVANGRDFVGIDLDERSVELAVKRISFPDWTGRDPNAHPRQTSLWSA